MYKTKMEALHGAVGRYVENRKREIQEEQKRQSKNSRKHSEDNDEY